MTSGDVPSIQAHTECCCENPAPARCASILLSHDGNGFVAQLLGSTGPKGRGSSYRAALASLEKLMAIRREFGPTNPVGGASNIRRLSGSRKYVPTLKARLVDRFGQLSNRELAARIGVVARDAPSMLSCALGGQGTRSVRCSIALALGELPSLLWPNRSDRIQKGDDDAYRAIASERGRSGSN